MTRETIGRIRGRRRRVLWLPLLALAPLAACDFDVTNPGPVQDKFLDDATAYAGIVNGMNRAFNDIWNEIARRGGSAVREVFPSGNTGRIGISVLQRQGILTSDDAPFWGTAQNARWVAEDGLQRFRRVLSPEQFSSSEVVARGYLWAGYANRFLGENYCDAVIDGGEKQAYTEYFVRADTQFARAQEIFTKLGKSTEATAAQAGRASALQGLNKWTEAANLAKAIPSSFKFQTRFSDIEEAQYNWMVWATASAPYRVFTVWNTFYADYFTQTGDPRVSWKTDPKFPSGDQPVGAFGQVPFYIQTKYTKLTDPVNVSSGREMRLIEAEALLVAGKWQEAMPIINALRTSVKSVKTGQPLQPWTATSPAEAWTAYAREHGIELWLEGRRLAARRRWTDAKWPITLDIHELPSETQPVHERGAGTFLDPDHDLCFPIGQDEFVTNPNLRGTG